MVALFLAGVDELPILTRLEYHFAEQRFFTVKLSADDLSEEVNFWDEICFGLEVL